jgi:hypothetical protein
MIKSFPLPPLAILLAWGLTACVSLPGKPVSAVREIDLEKSEVPARRDWTEGQRVKVIVTPVEGGDFHAARHAQIDALLARGLERAVDEAGGEVIDRALASRLKDELRLAEARGSGVFEGPAVAHFAVKPSFDKVAINSLREEKGILSKLVSKKDEPPTYKHQLVVEGSVRIYELPNMKLVQTLQFAEPFTEQNASSNLPNADARLREAFEKAFVRIRSDFKNLVAPRGAVMRKGMTEGGVVFQVMIGREHRVEPRGNVKIVSVSASGEETPVAEATVTPDVAARSAWVSVGDPQAAAKVREGDLGRLVIDDSLLGKLKVW